ncbi:helix-turn-helix domain-containing protein [uncultured Rhodoblastus sp.]|uniref:helix-turn-helix domain-containing protein n=1 Tax=uncultured Rhodoblastus sp. TaxID=543037 RepID=UPI0025CC2D49|nr:helix-turn-helix domain-containing protein [uncultured Rhodoblastus sp.]
MARRYNIRRVKIHRSYEVSEAAKLLDVSKRSINRWIDAGLPLVVRKRPRLILGKHLREFLQAHQPKKQPCRAGEIFCVGCQTPQRPAFDEVEYIPKTATTGLLAGLCPVCASMIYRFTTTATLAAASGDLKVAGHPAQQRLCDSPDPSLNVHLKEEKS